MCLTNSTAVPGLIPDIICLTNSTAVPGLVNGNLLTDRVFRASDIFQGWCARMTHGAKYGGSFSEMMRPII